MRFINGTSQIPPASPPSYKMNGPLLGYEYEEITCYVSIGSS